MKYIKANNIFPEELLKQIQKYVQGELIYIPKPEELEKKWGENSGHRVYLDHRNSQIRENFLWDYLWMNWQKNFCLSIESIKRIVYSK